MGPCYLHRSRRKTNGWKVSWGRAHKLLGIGDSLLRNWGILNIRRRARYLEIIGCWFVEKLARETPKEDLLHGSSKNKQGILALCKPVHSPK